MRWSCKCGAVEATVMPNKGARLLCYCSHCQAFAKTLGAADALDDAGGSDILQTAPDSMTIERGKEHLKCLQLTEKGPLRWYANCCNTPIANTLQTRSVPFLSVMSFRLDNPDDAGPILARVNRKDATAHIEGDAGSMRKVVVAFALRALKSRLNGGYKHNPFFDTNGSPIAHPEPVGD